MEEIWKDIPDYEGAYQVSNLGRVQSIYRKVITSDGRNQRLIKPSPDGYGYDKFTVSKNGIRKCLYVHKLVAIVFLNHSPCGFELVINHKNFIRNDNNVNNLEIVTTRENTNLKHIKSSSQYTGVSWNRFSNKWISSIRIKGKRVHLGNFRIEKEASDYYEKALIALKNNTDIIGRRYSGTEHYDIALRRGGIDVKDRLVREKNGLGVSILCNEYFIP
jgi:hypothetical protein